MRIAYQLVTIVVFIVLVAAAWFVCAQYMGAVQAASRAIVEQVGGVDSNFIAADQFITGLFMGFLAVGFIALAVWVYTYTQREGI